MFIKTLLLCIALTLTACSESVSYSKFQAIAQSPVLLAKKNGASENGEPLRAVTLPDVEQLNSPIVNLGRTLFHDTRLSADGTISCASCHGIDEGGDDGLPVAIGIRGLEGPINSPTVLNSGFNFRQFWDGRARTLSDQAKGPVEAGVEMGATWANVVARLSEDEALRARFERVFNSNSITEQRVVDAIARFEETLITPAPFDQYLNGDTTAISKEARAGYEKFKNYGCVSCHQGINVGGNLYQQFGVMHSINIDDFLVSGAAPTIKPRDHSVALVKVPSLRNIALTAPYFHQGKVNDLATAVRIMGLSQIGLEIPQDDISEIVEFLESLTGDWEVHAALIP